MPTFKEKIDALYDALKDYEIPDASSRRLKLNTGFFSKSSQNFIRDMKSKGDNFDLNLSRGQKNYINSLHEKLEKAIDTSDEFYEKYEGDPEFREKYENALLYYTFFTEKSYYSADSLFLHHAKYINEGERYLIDMSRANQMVNNKYFKKAYENYKGEPKYEKGSLVRFRKNGKILRSPWSPQRVTRDNPWSPSRSSRRGYGRTRVPTNVSKYLSSTFKVKDRLELLLNHRIKTRERHLMKGPLYILDVDRVFPISSCNGCKIYHVLPLVSSGHMVPIAIEERHLKNYRG